jgi:hypothetical protein
MGLRDELRLVDTRKARNAAAQRRRRQRMLKHESVFRLPLHGDLVTLLLREVGFGILTDRRLCEEALAAWVQEQCLRVTADSRDEETRLRVGYLKLELRSKVRAA